MNDHPSAACGLALAPEPTPDLREVLRRFDHEATHATFDTSRYRCRYHVWGRGPGLLFIPGLSSDARSFALLMSRLQRHFRCIVYDLPTGQGDGALLDRYRHADLVADAFALLDHVGERQCYVSGFSFGSTIALAAMHSQPERLVRAVLQSGFARRRLAPAEVLMARLARHWRAPLGRMPVRPMILHLQHRGPFIDRPPAWWHFFMERSGATPVAAVAQRALMIHHTDLRSLLPAIRQPVLLVSGACDPLVDVSCVEELREGLPNAAHIELRECGHHALFTHPVELAEAIRQFLSPPACATDCH
jgi:pimeloyl-ACP methyl ester carboxylesterase